MRIALVASLVSPIREAAANGPHAVILDLARGLTGLGHSVVVYAAAGSEADGVEVGDKVLFPKDAGFEVRLSGSPVRVVKRSDLIARVHD